MIKLITDTHTASNNDNLIPIFEKDLKKYNYFTSSDKILINVETQKALTVATKTTDTIKIVEGGKVVKTLNRDLLYNIQTPQAFEYNLIKFAHEKLKGHSFSDDAGMVENIGESVYILDNDYKNIKITTKNDLHIAKIYLNI